MAVVIELRTGERYAGVGRRSTTAKTRAAIAALRAGHNMRKSIAYVVDEYKWVGRYETAGIVVDEYA